MNRFYLALLTLSLSISAVAEDGFSSLEEQMTGKEFTATGLGKLSPAELEALNEWIRSHSLATLDAPKSGAVAATRSGTDDRGFDEKMGKADKTPIHSRIKGSFTGWDGQTIFELDNGMIWEQADNDTFYIRAVENPEVTIEPGAFRTWRLSVAGYSSECRVERIQ